MIGVEVRYSDTPLSVWYEMRALLCIMIEMKSTMLWEHPLVSENVFLPTPPLLIHVNLLRPM